ncbi:MAG: bifunctional oligoribonuclease/PAP phosphatase NrnA [Bacteroidia bacterium]
MNQTPIEQLRAHLSRPRRIVITTHQRPDGDAIGSSLGLYHYLVKQGHRITVITPTDYPDFLKWLPGDSQVLVGPADPQKANWEIEAADLLFCLDFNDLARLGDFEKAAKESEARKILIDHHLDPVGFEELAFWDPTASSAAEMVYRLIDDMGDRDKIDLPTAEALYMGIMTDTGSFRFTNTSPAVHRIVAHLMEVGVDVNKAHELIFSNATVDRLRFLGHVLTHCLFVLPEYRMAYVKLEKEVFKQFNVKTGDTEGLVNYALGIKGIDLGVMLSAQDDIIKLSFRSRGEVSSSDLAQQFEGGGHFYASGGKSKESMAATEQRLIALVQQNMQPQTS